MWFIYFLNSGQFFNSTHFIILLQFNVLKTIFLAFFFSCLTGDVAPPCLNSEHVSASGVSSLNGELLPVEQLLLVSIRLFFRLFEGFFRVFVGLFFVLCFGFSTKSSSESSDGSESMDASAL